MNIWKDYYPTPLKLIDSMLSKVDFRKVKTALEPQAGKGNIAAILKNKKVETDVIEINPELQHILKGQGFRVVWDDFITFESLKKYDLIIMNPPFSNGADHLLKAIELMKPYGGQIVCLLNANTLLGTTNKQQHLNTLLSDLEADITIHKNTFVDAERITSVDVAMIYIEVKGNSDSVLFEHFKHEEVDKWESSFSNNNNTLVNGDYIKGLIEQYNFEIKCGVRLINDYLYLTKHLFKEKTPSFHYRSLELTSSERNLDVNEFIKSTRSKYWSMLFESDDLKQMLTSDIKSKYMAQIDEMSNYDFNSYNIIQLKYDISKGLVNSLETTIIQLFDDFSHNYSYYDECKKNIHLYNGWKTNKAWKINQKVIIPMKTTYWYNGSLKINQLDIVSRIQDIEKVFNYLSIDETADIDLQTALDQAQNEGCTRNIQLKHFTVTFYKKGTCHITFTNKKALQRFNIYGSQQKQWLPPSYGKKHYKDLNKDEKDTVDSFNEGCYDAIVNSPSDYIFNPTKQLLIA